MMQQLNMLPSNASVLILDWGIGGMGAFKNVRARWPDVDIVYWSDSGQLPYGKMSHEVLQQRLETIISCAANAGVTHVIIACNAASTALDGASLSVPTIGVITPTVDALIKKHADDVLGIIGGRRTVESGAYAIPLSAAGVHVVQNVAQPLSAIIEAGEHHQASHLETFKEILAPVAHVDRLVLACTHYIAAIAVIERILPNTAWFEPVDACLDWIQTHWQLRTGQGHTTFVTTGDPMAMQKGARMAFDVHVPHAHVVAI